MARTRIAALTAMKHILIIIIIIIMLLFRTVASYTNYVMVNWAKILH